MLIFYAKLTQKNVRWGIFKALMFFCEHGVMNVIERFSITDGSHHFECYFSRNNIQFLQLILRDNHTVFRTHFLPVQSQKISQIIQHYGRDTRDCRDIILHKNFTFDKCRLLTAANNVLISISKITTIFNKKLGILHK